MNVELARAVLLSLCASHEAIGTTAHYLVKKSIEIANEFEAMTAPDTDGGRSVCTCGHTGDGPHSQHEDLLENGHGECLVDGCSCRQFTWARRR